MRSALLALLSLQPLFAATVFETTVQPFTARYCVSCHNSQLKSGGLDLKTETDLSRIELWRKVLSRVEAGEMPPAGAPHPGSSEIQSLASNLKAEFARQDALAPADPGRVTLRRLNRYEYNASIRDLLGVEFRPADDFPADDFAYGFDNIGDVLSLSPALMEKYMTAAKKIAQLAIDAPAAPKRPVVDHLKNRAEAWPFTWNRRFTWEGDYEIRFAIPYFVDNRHDPGTIFISIDGAEPRQFPLATEYANEGRYQDVKLHLTAGIHELKGWALRDETVTLADEIKKDQARAARSKDPAKPQLSGEELEKKIAAARQPYIESVEVHGPWNPRPAPRPESYVRIFACGEGAARYGDPCIKSDLTEIARLAWRRPVTPAESNKLFSFVRMARKQGDNPDNGMKVGLMAILVSPNFLFRTERRLGSYELASRLSYFLWSSIPDERLLTLAGQDKLTDLPTVEAEVRRMLNDAKASAIVDNFGAQWLLVRNLDSINPDPDKFPFTGAVRAAMKEETRLFFTNILRQDSSILDFLNAKYTWVNEPLAKLYGLPGVTGNDFRKVDLTGTPRRGIITQGSVLTVSSYATRTSPVIRGKWILENILNAPPPPPPANVPSLDASGTATGTPREQMEKHRENAVCASCHAKMDPLGFGLENFDAIGRWRTMDGKSPIDSKGTLPNGKTFSGPDELLDILAQDKEAFTRCLTEKLMTFALGRGLEPNDRPAVDRIVSRVAEQNYKFSSLIVSIAESAPFQMRREQK